MSEFMLGGVIRLSPEHLGVSDKSLGEQDKKGYAVKLKLISLVTKTDDEGATTTVEADSFKKNTWYSLTPKSRLACSKSRVTFFVSPTLELLKLGDVRTPSIYPDIKDLTILWKPNSQVSADEIDFHCQVVAIEGVE